MARNKYIPKKKHDGGKHLVRQKALMQKHFPCFDCSLRHRVLDCTGQISPCDDCDTYRIRIMLALSGVPKVRILEPEIPWSSKIHVFSNENLCLYDHREQPWKATDFLHEKIVPWTAEWLVFYELFLLTGEWHGPEAPHGSGNKEPQKK